MATSIPVQVAGHHFSSINQARLFFTGILHTYDQGGRLSEQHQHQVMALMTSSGSVYPQTDEQVRVSKGYFGRSCFVSIGPNKESHYVSIVHSLKKIREAAEIESRSGMK